MISFDRRTGNVNLTPIWNEINSIKSDTNSLYTMITAGGGGDIPQELLNSITLLNSNTGILSSDITLLNSNTGILSSDITLLNSNTTILSSDITLLTSNTSTIANDTISLNMDVVSLYNICSSLSDSISTITGGGGGGSPYYLNVSDVLSQSLKYAYNVSGDILSLPYDSFSLYGNLGNFINYAVPTGYLNIDISGLKTMESITMTASGTSRYYNIHLTASEINKCRFAALSSFGFSANEIKSCTFYTIYNNQELINVGSFNSCLISLMRGLAMNAYMISGCTFENITNTIYANIISTCTLSICESIQASSMEKCFFTNCLFIDALEIRSCTISSNWYNNVVNAITFSHNAINNFYNTGVSTIIIPSCFNCVSFKENTLSHLLYSMNFVGKDFINNSFRNMEINVSKGCLNISYRQVQSNKFFDIRQIIINSIPSFFNNSFARISNLRINYEFNELSIRGSSGSTINQNTFENIAMLDVKDIDITCTLHFGHGGVVNYLGVSTMKMNYSLLRFSTKNSNIQPSNIYTLDFYNCKPWIVNSVFYIPSYYSGYNEGNVWISGKPIADYGYSLSTTTLN